MVDPNRRSRPARPTGFLDQHEFEVGLAGLTANDGFRDPLTVPPEWRTKHGSLGAFGPTQALHLYPGDPHAFEQAFILAGHVDAPDLRYLFNGTGSSVFGGPRRADMRFVRGAAFMTSYRPVPHYGEGPADPRTGTAWSLDHLRFLNAGLRPDYILDYVRGTCWAILLLEKPVFMHGDERRGRLYDAIVRDLAKAAGGIAAEDPLRTTVPMPGACLVRQYGCEPAIVTPSIFIGGAELYGSHESRSHGTCLEDLADVAARLRATPRFDAAA